jgi:hypothetical protein
MRRRSTPLFARQAPHARRRRDRPPLVRGRLARVCGGAWRVRDRGSFGGPLGRASVASPPSQAPPRARRRRPGRPRSPGHLAGPRRPRRASSPGLAGSGASATAAPRVLVDGEHGLAHLDLVVGLDVHLADHAGDGGRDLDHGLVGLELEHGLVDLDAIAFGDQDRHHGADFDAFADLGEFELSGHVAVASSSRQVRVALLGVDAQVGDGPADHVGLELAVVGQGLQRRDGRRARRSPRSGRAARRAPRSGRSRRCRGSPGDGRVGAARARRAAPSCSRSQRRPAPCPARAPGDVRLTRRFARVEAVPPLDRQGVALQPL